MPRNIDYIRSLTVEELADKLSTDYCPDIFEDSNCAYWKCRILSCEKCWQEWQN